MSFETSTHHCAIFQGDDHGANHRGFKNCTLNPGHEDFMTVEECLSKRPSEIGLCDDDDMSRVKTFIDRTVRVVVYHVSNDRPDTFIKSQTAYPCVENRGSCIHIRYGTGFLVRRCTSGVKGPCPCFKCKRSPCQTSNQKSYYFIIVTATHVIFDKWEAQNAIFEFFYDSEDRSNVEKVFGVTVLDSYTDRLQTDKCSVVCVTHDGSLAEKLHLFCGQCVFVNISNVLVSHPHGVSKRISVDDEPQSRFHFTLNKTCVILKKDTEIRFPGCHDANRVAQDISCLLDNPVIVYNDLDNTFVLSCDLRVYRPKGIVLDVDYNDYGLKRKYKVWCNVITPGTRLVTDNGNTYTFPYKDDKAPVVRMEVLEKTEYFLDKNEEHKHSVFTYHRYKMASCPGSSGALVKSLGFYLCDTSLKHVHFGGSNHYNTSSLFCIHTPEGELESITSTMDRLLESGCEK